MATFSPYLLLKDDHKVGDSPANEEQPRQDMDPNAGLWVRGVRAADAPDGQTENAKPAPRLLVISTRDGSGRRTSVIAWLGRV
ncbi:hypothetical protein [Marimonas lutisalis]|uniref:hypothetical protein n=1 Tax=Marimonas lutisalis TaxID=2545756 RepID=UPI0010F95CF9|nr:hypothetical protein [Marimonas lutisalis]